ncbi:hypothetical protein IJH02_03075 [Candidatus Saccharibacteria bacterium]|nr:hypothetical protein [Candidatus Saccharibacteria bacterium]
MDTKKSIIVATLVVALIMSLIIPVTTGTSEAQAAETEVKAATNGLWTYSYDEYGTLFTSATQTSSTVGVKTSAGKEIKFVSYPTAEGINFDFTDGEDYYSYRTNTLNNVVTITSRIKGVVRNQSAYIEGKAADGVVYVDNYGWITERHYISPESWQMEEYNYNGQVTKSVVKVLVRDGYNASAFVSTTTMSETQPTTPSSSPQPFWPTATPSATPYNPYNPYQTAPPFTPPTMQPTQAPVATQPPVQTQVPVATTPPTQEPPVVVEPTLAPATPSKSLSNLKRSTKIEKRAYKSLKKLNRLAKSHGWTLREYTRRASNKRVVKTKVYLEGYAGFKDGKDYYGKLWFTHVCQRYGGKKYAIRFWQDGKWVKGIRKKIKYHLLSVI